MDAGILRFDYAAQLCQLDGAVAMDNEDIEHDSAIIRSVLLDLGIDDLNGEKRLFRSQKVVEQINEEVAISLRCK